MDPVNITADEARALVETLVTPEQKHTFDTRHKSPSEKMALALHVLKRGSEGATDRTIAAELGCSHTTVGNYRRMAFLTVAAPQVTEARLAMVMQLDQIIEANMALALTGDDKAATTVLKALDRKAKLLGLDAPILVDQTTTTITAEEREAQEFVAQMERDALMREAADDHAQH